MDWQLFWEAFGAIGTTVGSLITAIAVVIAVIQYKQPLIKKLKITVGTSYPLNPFGLGEPYLCITLANAGIRPINIEHIYIKVGKKNLMINNIIFYLTAESKIQFPKELLPESAFDVYVPYPKLSESLQELINENKISAKRNLKILAVDTTSGKHYCKMKCKAKQIANLGITEDK